MKDYKDRLYELRIDNDLKQEDVAKVLSCTKQAYGHYVNGKRNLPLEQFKKLCNVSLDYICGITDIKKEYPKK